MRKSIYSSFDLDGRKIEISYYNNPIRYSVTRYFENNIKNDIRGFAEYYYDFGDLLKAINCFSSFQPIKPITLQQLEKIILLI